MQYLLVERVVKICNICPYVRLEAIKDVEFCFAFQLYFIDFLLTCLNKIIIPKQPRYINGFLFSIHNKGMSLTSVIILSDVFFCLFYFRYAWYSIKFSKTVLIYHHAHQTKRIFYPIFFSITHNYYICSRDWDIKRDFLGENIYLRK